MTEIPNHRIGTGKDLQVAASTVIACVVFAIAARALNTNIGYANDFDCDTWYFLGIQLDFDLFYQSGIQQALRFGAILPWTYLAQILEYETLNFIRFITYFVLTCSAFVWFNFRLFGIRIAVLTTVAFCCSTSFLGVLSHDYVTGAGLAWISLFIASTVEAGGSRHLRSWSVAAGILFGMCFYTHLPTAFFIIAIPLLFTALPSDESRLLSRVVVFTAWSLIGFIGVTVVLGLYSVSLGGSFFFLGPSLNVGLSSFRDLPPDSVTGRIPGFGWLAREGIVPFLGTMTIGSLILVFRERGRIVRNPAGAAALAALITSVFVVWLETGGRILLQYNVYGPWIFPLLFASLGAMLSRVPVLRTLSNEAFLGLVCSILVLAMGAALTTRSPESDHLLLLTKIACGLAFLLAFVLFAATARGALVLVPLTALVLLSFPTTYGKTPWYSGEALARPMTLQAANAVSRYRSLGIQGIPVFWVGGSTPAVISVPRSFLVCENFAASFPNTAKGDRGREPAHLALTPEYIGSARTLVVVATGHNLGATAKARLGEMGFESAIVGEWPIGSGQLQTSMAVLRLNGQ